jgi:hypothetical protein
MQLFECLRQHLGNRNWVSCSCMVGYSKGSVIAFAKPRLNQPLQMSSNLQAHLIRRRAAQNVARVE